MFFNMDKSWILLFSTELPFSVLFNKFVQAKLDEMEKSVANPDVGSDLRGVKELLKKHQGLENDLTGLDEQIQTIVSEGQALADAGHFDRVGILKIVDQFHKRYV